MQKLTTKRSLLTQVMMAASVVLSVSAQAQDDAPKKPRVGHINIQAPLIEEVLTIGRLQSAADAIVNERVEQAFAADILGFEQISRAGDADVAAALKRVTGLTLVDNKYIYVRSLGERYSSTLLNGAAVPSPELTRNVLPLDLFPSSIVKTLKVQKAYSPDLPASFGGGNIDIRTQGIPDDVVFEVTLGAGLNSNSRDDGISYNGGSKDNSLPPVIANALDLYQGSLNNGNIVKFVDTDGGSPSSEQLQQAEQINRDLMLSLNRDIAIDQKSLPADLEGKLSLGNSWYVGDDWRIGALANVSHDTEWRNKNQIRQGIGNPEGINSEVQRTTEQVRELGAINAGASYQDMHTLEASYFYINNREDTAAISQGFDANNTLADNTQVVSYQTRFEQRELKVAQLMGEHQFEQVTNGVLDDINLHWFYSDSKANTDVPNEVNIQATNDLEPVTGKVFRSRLLSTTSMATFAFLTLEDKVKSYGWNAELPLNFGRNLVTLSGGYSYNDKARSYYGYTANINASGVATNVLQDSPDQVLSDQVLGNIDNNFELSMGSGFGTESYVAAQMTDAAYGMIDINLDYVWRFTAGARYEDFRQAVLPIDLLDYSGITIDKLNKALSKKEQSYAIGQDGWYPSVALTFMNQGFMDADDFQVRASYSQTVVRPDLREVSEVQYIDPELGIRVQGNPGLRYSDLNHFDLRTEWFYSGGDNFTVSLFYKDITDPIEQSRAPGSDDDVLLEFYNAESGKIYGAEFEGMKNVGAGFFTSANFTLSDSEIVSPDGLGFTNVKRRMTGHSEYVVNFQVGFDSDNGKHSASVLYNVFGDRVYYAARSNGHDDAYEQPFNSLDIAYSFYPIDTFSFSLKLKNILQQDREFKQVNSASNNVTILKQEQGMGASLAVNYSF